MSEITNKSARTGILLINLGTPDATDYRSMRRYLKEFLSDPRVIEVNPLIWWPLLNGVILSVRPQKSGRNYDKIWNYERNESPLRSFTRSQADKLRQTFEDADQPVMVDWAMRYGTPSIAQKLKAMTNAGCDRILLFPLYPQYSASTTATANDKAFDALKTMRLQPAIRTVPPYYDRPEYISALAKSVRSTIDALDWKPEIVLASFHGIPKSYAEKGDPYPDHCTATFDLLAADPQVADVEFRQSFQSRVGAAEWLRPYTDETIAELGKSGIKRLAVITPGFTSDCIETLEEIAMEGAEIFNENGGEKFIAIPCLNDTDDSIALFRDIVLQELQGWSPISA